MNIYENLQKMMEINEIFTKIASKNAQIALKHQQTIFSPKIRSETVLTPEIH